MNNESRRPACFRMEGDRQIAYVPLANNRGTAELYAEDYHRIVEAGYSPDWHVTVGNGHRAFVVTQYKDVSIIAARLIAGAMPGTRVKYADGNRFNLRRENLLLTEGPSKVDARIPLEICEGLSLEKRGSNSPVAPVEVAA